MSSYKRATLDEEDLVDSSSEDVYSSTPMQVNTRTKFKKKGFVWHLQGFTPSVKPSDRKISANFLVVLEIGSYV